ncbi:MAG: Hsp20/alpha crystallin family protein [Spirochaetales bacterium]
MARELMNRGNEGWAPSNELRRLQDEINSLFNFDGWDFAPGLFDRNMAPALDMVENTDDFVVTVDLPGVSQDDVDLSVADNVLTIKGEKKGESESEERNYFRKETWQGSFQRTVSLPQGVDPDNVQAEMKNGVLSITLPKREEAKPRKINVNVK